MLRSIVAVDSNNGIGYKNDLLFHIPEDMRFFRNITKGNTVVMGRKTFESMNNTPLKNRTNLVISSNPHEVNINNDNVDNIVVGNLYEINDLIKKKLSNDEDVYIIGGASIYDMYIDACKELYITKYTKSYDNVDTYFPDPSIHGFHKALNIKCGIYDNTIYYIDKWVKLE